MEKVCEKKYCTGCTACYTICPQKAITMVEDEEGFKYPAVDQEKCINCGLCKKICPVINTHSNESNNKCYAAYNKNKKELKKSSSGAIFSLIAELVIEKNGIVIGAIYDNNTVLHKAINKKADLDLLKGSKYVQSDIGDLFQYIKNNIQEKKILFVGTPCQVAGLKRVVKNDNLICLDFICHGVPSPALFKKYVQELEEEEQDEVINYNFRDKKPTWEDYSNTITFKNKIKTESFKNNIYMKIFSNDIALRRCCYDCNFKIGNKFSDITLGDFWNVKEHHREMHNDMGVSAIIINTIKGQQIFDEIKEKTIYKECNIQEIINENPSLKESAEMNLNRKIFLKKLKKYNIEKLYKKYEQNKYSRLNRIINKILKKHL